jgi:hypothetical protein
MDRIALTQPRPNRHDHFRYVAVEYAKQAAALVPPRSQAFAAILSYAYDIQNYDRKTLESIYKMYKDARPAYVFWVKGEPDFDQAEKMSDEEKKQ